VDLDLLKEAEEVYSYVAARASAYSANGDRGPGGDSPVKMVYAGYEFDQEGWFALIFDRRPDAAHDGEWTSFLDGNRLERPKWATAGWIRRALRGNEFGQQLGRMLVGVLLRADGDGVFASLPRADGFKLGLEEFNGSLGWDSETGFGGAPQ
jgi:hypothetical protein